jgi:hypothetical protein
VIALMRMAASVAQHPPAAVTDPLLWWHGVALAERHRAHPEAPGRCLDAACRSESRDGCWVRLVAERLIAASYGSWPQCWTARHDARSCGLPVPEVPLAQIPSRAAPPHRAATRAVGEGGRSQAPLEVLQRTWAGRTAADLTYQRRT